MVSQADLQSALQVPIVGVIAPEAHAAVQARSQAGGGNALDPGGAALVVRREGDTTSHHSLTHEEPIDLALGYQPNATWFIDRCMEGLNDFLQALSSIKEGQGSLLDRMLIFAASDTGCSRPSGCT